MDATHGSGILAGVVHSHLGHLVGPPGYFKIILSPSILQGGKVEKGE